MHLSIGTTSCTASNSAWVSATHERMVVRSSITISAAPGTGGSRRRRRPWPHRAAALPRGVRRTVVGDAVTGGISGDLQDHPSVARPERRARHSDPLVPTEPTPWLETSSETEWSPRPAGWNAAVHLYDPTPGRYKALIVDHRTGALDEETWAEFGDDRAVRPLPDGTPVSAVRLIFPVRDNDGADARASGRRGFEMTTYPGGGGFWQAFHWRHRVIECRLVLRQAAVEVTGLTLIGPIPIE